MTTRPGSVAWEQRFRGDHRCPACAGASDEPQGAGVRCWGFLSDDGRRAICTREEYAGRLPLTDAGYVHHLRDDCGCGQPHDGAARARRERMQGQTATRNGHARVKVNETRFELKDVDGKLVAVHVRHDYSDGTKEMPWEPSGLSVEGLPLYGVHELPCAPADESVIVTEGEKARDAVTDHGITAVGTVTGAKTIPDDDVLRPLLGRPVVLWPDNDDDGHRHMRRIADRLHALGHRDVRWFEWPDAPAKGDAADFFDGSGGAVEGLRDMLAAAPSAAPRRRVRLQRARDLTAPPVRWHIEQLTALGMLNMVSGRDGLGKTLLVMEMIQATLFGRPFLGRFAVQQPGRVAALLLDDPPSLTNERLQRVGIKNHPGLWIATPDDVDLDDPIAMLADLETVVTEHRLSLVVVDALYLLLPTSRDAGNDAARMRPIVQALNRVAERTDAAVVVVAHDTKNGVDVAGSYAIRAGFKVILRLLLPSGERVDPDLGPTTHERVLQLNKSKMASATAWRLRLDGPGNWTVRGTAAEARTADLRATAREALAGGERALDAVARELGRRTDDVRTALDALVAEGAAARRTESPSGGRGRPRVLYGLVPGQPPHNRPDGKSSGEGVGTENPDSNPASTRTFPGEPSFPSNRPALGGGQRDGNSPGLDSANGTEPVRRHRRTPAYMEDIEP